MTESLRIVEDCRETRLRCCEIVSQMPVDGLKEAEEVLTDMIKFYREIDEIRRNLPEPVAPAVVTAKIT